MNREAEKLDETTRARLDELLRREDRTLTQEEREFFRARAYYIKDKHQERFPSVFGKGFKREEEAEQPPVDSALDHTPPFGQVPEDDGADEVTS